MKHSQSKDVATVRRRRPSWIIDNDVIHIISLRALATGKRPEQIVELVIRQQLGAWAANVRVEEV